MINSFSLFDFDIHNVYTNNIEKFYSWKFTCRTGKKEYGFNWSKYKRKTVSHFFLTYFRKKIDSLWKRLAILFDKIVTIEFADDGWIFDCKRRLSRACF